MQITPEIEAIAQELEHNPVKIYNWVHNNIQFIPTYGSIQGSQMTLETKSGNAIDTASLLIALFRASSIHSRYAYGTVRIPIDKVMNWTGNISTPEMAIQLLANGGIPVTALTQSGQIAFVKMEPVWVEAWVDFFPSRATKHVIGDSWVSMDASFKQYAFSEVLALVVMVAYLVAFVMVQAFMWIRAGMIARAAISRIMAQSAAAAATTVAATEMVNAASATGNGRTDDDCYQEPRLKIIRVSFENDLTIDKDEAGQITEIKDPVWVDANRDGETNWVFDKNERVGYAGGKEMIVAAEFMVLPPYVHLPIGTVIIGAMGLGFNATGLG